MRTGDYDLLAGVLLAVTGCEALFAKYVNHLAHPVLSITDQYVLLLLSSLGQFNRLSIQLAFGLFVYPCLVLAYLGQGARLIADGEAVFTNVFYQTIPGETNGPLFW